MVLKYQTNNTNSYQCIDIKNLSFTFVSNLLLLTLDQNFLYLFLIPTHNQLILKLEVDPLRPNYY